LALEPIEVVTEVFCWQLSERFKRLRSLVDVAEFENVSAFERKRDEAKTELDNWMQHCGLPPGGKLKNYDYFERSKIVGLDALYRGMYFHLSHFSHPSMSIGAGRFMQDKPIPSVDMLTLLVPLEAAETFHALDPATSGDGMIEKFADIHDRIQISVFGG
jgi:hypothetical protein